MSSLDARLHQVPPCAAKNEAQSPIQVARGVLPVYSVSPGTCQGAVREKCQCLMEECAHTCTHTCGHTHMHMHTCACTYIYMHVHARMHANITNTHMCTHTAHTPPTSQI